MFNLVAIRKSNVLHVDSREVAEMIKKEHWELLRMLEGYEPKEDGNSRRIVGIIPTLRNHNVEVSEYFIEASYKTEGNNKTYKCHLCTKMGCEMLGNKLQGENGILFTAKYVKKFNQMEEQIKLELQTKEDFKEMTEAIKKSKENPKQHHYTNEINMINRMVLGCTAKEYKTKNNIPKGEGLRDHLSYEQLSLIDTLQKINASMILLGMEYKERKIRLENYKLKLVA